MDHPGYAYRPCTRTVVFLMRILIELEDFELTELQVHAIGKFILSQCPDLFRFGRSYIKMEESSVFDNHVKIETENDNEYWFISPDGELEEHSWPKNGGIQR